VVIFDKFIKMYEQVSSVCPAAYYHLKSIHCLKTFLTQEAFVTVVHAFVTSRLDHCNFLLYGISDYNINRHQLIQNSATRMVTNTWIFDHITHIFQNLYWLHVRHGIHFKIVLITRKSVNDIVLECLCVLMSIRKSFRKLRSSSQILLQVPMSRRKIFGDCVLTVATPTLWNRLLVDIRNENQINRKIIIIV